LGFYQVVKDVLKLKSKADPSPAIEVAGNSGWWWPFQGGVILSERPTILSQDDQNRLHCEDGPAIQYPDGWGVWAVHGVRVSRELIEDHDWITVDRIQKESNAEIRRIMLDRYGYARYLEKSGAAVVDQDVDQLGLPRRLLRTEISGDEPLVMVEVKNSTPESDGSRKTYHLRVPPYIESVQEAIAWGWDMKPKDYQPLVET
jgi:hypothetical protein